MNDIFQFTRKNGTIIQISKLTAMQYHQLYELILSCHQGYLASSIAGSYTHQETTIEDGKVIDTAVDFNSLSDEEQLASKVSRITALLHQDLETKAKIQNIIMQVSFVDGEAPRKLSLGDFSPANGAPHELYTYVAKALIFFFEEGFKAIS